MQKPKERETGNPLADKIPDFSAFTVMSIG
jgi:hypothetical protein